MALPGDLIVGALTAGFALGGVYFAAGGVREGFEAARVVTGPAGDPTAGDDERGTYFAATVADDPGADTVTLGQVRDEFGYWLVRFWATGGGTNAFAALGRGLLSVAYGPEDYRNGDDRRRGSAAVPSSVPVRADGQSLGLSLGDDARPLQRLEADGATVPFLAGVGVVLLGFALLFSPIFLLAVRLFPPVGVAYGAVVALVVGGLVGGKVYHDTGLVGGWSRVTAVDDEDVPTAVAEAGATEDPASTARCDLVEVEPGDPVRVVGTLESTAEGLRVIDGVVSTRGRWFLAVAAVLDAVRTFVFAALCLLTAAVGTGLLAPSLVVGLVGGP